MLTTGDAELDALHLETQSFALLARDDEMLPPSDPVRPAELAGAALIVGQQGTGTRSVAEAVRHEACPGRAG
ncbi:hypothetical protein ACPZ19_27145 [Amycolatopsis lurida]